MKYMRSDWAEVKMKLKLARTYTFGCILFCCALMHVNCYTRVDVKERAKQTVRLWTENEYTRRSKRSTSEYNGEITRTDLLLLNPGEELKFVNSLPTSQGFFVEKLQETYKDVPIFDGALTVEVSSNGVLTGGATGTLIQDIGIDLPDITPKLSKADALDILISLESDTRRRSEIGDVTTDLWIYPLEDGIAKLVYFVQYLIQSTPAKRPTSIIDALNGEVLLRYDAVGKVGCSRESIFGLGGNTKRGVVEYGEEPYCIEPTKTNEGCLLENKYVRVINMNHSKSESSTSQETMSYPCNTFYNDDYFGPYSPSLDAYFHGTIVSKMYEEWIGDTPLREKLVLRVHYGDNYENALWNGQNFSFGDGGVRKYPLVSLDIVGHEIGHGVVERYSNLLFIGESGGVNEAFADIFGESSVAFFSEDAVDWVIGREVTRTLPFMRSFENPDVEGSISHVDNVTSSTLPHKASGVFRLAFFNIVEKHNVSFEMALRVFDRANKLYWHHMSSFHQAGCDVIKAAYDLGQDVPLYEESFAVVGITNCSILENIPSLIYDRRYEGITVSDDTHPIFKFETPPWTHFVTVYANSSDGDVEIIVGDAPDLLTYGSHIKGIGDNIVLVRSNGGIDLYIGLYPASTIAMDVTLMVTYECKSYWDPSEDPSSIEYIMQRCVFLYHCKRSQFETECNF